jgi:hypothetical protein
MEEDSLEGFMLSYEKAANSRDFNEVQWKMENNP